MKEKEFFEVYIPALEQALLNDHINHGYMVSGPDRYIEDLEKRKDADLFEERNYENFKSLFQSVAMYFDAKSHGFNEIEGTKIESFKNILKDEISKYKKMYQHK